MSEGSLALEKRRMNDPASGGDAHGGQPTLDGCGMMPASKLAAPGEPVGHRMRR